MQHSIHLLQEKIDEQLRVFFEEKIATTKKQFPVLVPILQKEKDFVMQGGKRIRPILVYMGYMMSGGTDKKAILSTSIFIELIHNYLLIHDDIIDQDDLRRGKATLHRQYEKHYENLSYDPIQTGTSLAIVAGDMLCAFGYELLQSGRFSPDKKLQATKKLNSILSDVIMGQTLDILSSTRQKITLQDILKLYQYKTAKYTIEGPLHLGAILAGANKKTLNVLSNYAIPLGIAFQIQDDILGMFGREQKTGKAVDSDIKDHKQNILIFQAIKRGNAQQKKEIHRIFNRKEITKSDIAKIKKIVKETGSFQYAQELVKKLADEAQGVMEKSLFSKQARIFFSQFADYLIRRQT